MSTHKSNAELVRWAVERVGAQEVDAARTVWSDGIVVRFPDRTCHGAEEVAAYFTDLYAAIDAFRIDINTVAEAGDDVFVHWHMTGRHTGPVIGVAGTGRPLEIDGMDHFVVRDGAVASNFVVFDQMQFARQVGLLPPHASVADRVLKAAFNARTRVVDAVTKRRR